MEFKRKLLIVVVILVCLLCLAYTVYYQVFVVNAEEEKNSSEPVEEKVVDEVLEFDKLFDNKLNSQGNYIEEKNRLDQTKELIYTSYSVNEIYEGKYEINANIPVVNIGTARGQNINKEIKTIFQDKLASIIANARTKEVVEKTIYTVDYTAYINENILSLVIKSTIKEGTNVQRLIIKAYTYNLSTNEEITLANMLDMKRKDTAEIEKETLRVVREAIGKTDNLAALGYNLYERDMNSTMYKIENSDNYFLGPEGTIYIIYAYGNSNLTSERDIVVVK